VNVTDNNIFSAFDFEGLSESSTDKDFEEYTIHDAEKDDDLSDSEDSALIVIGTSTKSCEKGIRKQKKLYSSTK
jgi:hypothetical protein